MANFLAKEYLCADSSVLGGIVSLGLLSISSLAAKVKAPRSSHDPQKIETEGNNNGRDDRCLRLQRKQGGIIHDQVDVGCGHHHQNRGEAGELPQEPQDEEYAEANLRRRNDPHIERVERDAG